MLLVDLGKAQAAEGIVHLIAGGDGGKSGFDLATRSGVCSRGQIGRPLPQRLVTGHSLQVVMKQAGAQVKQLHRDLAVMEVRAGIDEVRRHRCVVPVRGEDQGDSARDGHLGIISQPGRGESGPGRSGQVGFVDWGGRRGVKWGRWPSLTS